MKSMLHIRNQANKTDLRLIYDLYVVDLTLQKILQYILYVGMVVHLPFKFYACRILLDLRMII